MRRYRSAAAVLVILAVSVSTVFAGPIGITPSRTTISLAPGKHRSETVTVTNNAEAVVACTLETADWTVARGTADGLEYHAAGTQKRSCTPWMQVSPVEFDLGVGEKQEISVSMTLPDTARGSYFSALLFNILPDAPAPSQGITTRTPIRLDHLVTVDTEERTTWAASVDTLHISRPDDDKPLVITAILRNEGNAGLWPEGSFAIVDEMETVWGKVDIEGYVAQPGGRVHISEKWEGILLPQPYRLVGTINIGRDKVLTPKLAFRVVNWMRIVGITVSERGDSLLAVVRIKNGGNITSTVDVLLEIRNSAGYRVGRIDGGETTVLPDDENELVFTLPELATGDYELTASIGSQTHQADASIRFKIPLSSGQ
jgi:hypothetical protein